MYKRHDRKFVSSDFAEAAKKFSDVGRDVKEDGERRREKESLRRERDLPLSFILPRGDKWKTVDERKRGTAREDGEMNSRRSVPGRRYLLHCAPRRCIPASMPALI